MSTKSTKTPWCSNRLTLPQLRNTRLISQKAITQLLMKKQTNYMTHYTPSKLHDCGPPLQDFKHYAMSMIHPVTGAIHQQLKTPDEQSRDCKGLDDSIWKRLWRDESRQQQDRPKRNKWDVCHAPLQRPKHPQEQSCYVCVGGR
jgi:hypothetical protein